MPVPVPIVISYVFSFQDDIYVEYAKVNKGDTPSEYSKYESGKSVDVPASQSIYYKIYSLLENKNDKITFYNPYSPDSDVLIKADYSPVVPENEIISVNGVDWILRNHFGFNGEDTNAQHNYGIRIERPDPPGINFKYPNAPRFRNQETPHVYFDTVKGGPTRTETHTYTYDDGTVAGEFQGDPIKKVLDFTSPDQLDGWGLEFGDRGLVLLADNFALASGGYYNFMGIVPGRLVITDKPVSIPGDAGLDGVTILEPGVYITDGLALVGEVTVAPDDGLFASFSKNVTVKAHTEYTSHINGRIGEGGGVLNALVLNHERPGNDDQAIIGATWEEAKDVFLSGKKVIIVSGKYYAECTKLKNNDRGDYLYFDVLDIKWFSDGHIDTGK